MKNLFLVDFLFHMFPHLHNPHHYLDFLLLNFLLLIFFLKVLKELVKAPNSELQMAQNLMFESFLTKGEDFVKNCTELLNNKKYKDNSFIKTSARLIGRRYIIENYELCNHRYQTFVNLVFGSLKNAYKAIGKSEK